MALETERCSPNNASSPGPTDNNRRPGLDDCSDQTKEMQSTHSRCKTPPPSTATVDTDGCSDTSTAVSAFRPVRGEDAVQALATDDEQTPAAAAALLLACSKPLSICSPLQNKTSAADKVLQTSPPPVQVPVAVPQHNHHHQQPLNRKKSVQKPAAVTVATDVPRWIHQQQQLLQHDDSQHAPQSATAQPPPTAATAAAVEYTMAMAAAAAAAASTGQVPPVFPFNSWMYRFNFLPIVPAAAAAEYFREMHHHHMQHQTDNSGGSSETVDEQQLHQLQLLQQSVAANHHLQPLHLHAAAGFAQQRQQQTIAAATVPCNSHNQTVQPGVGGLQSSPAAAITHQLATPQPLLHQSLPSQPALHLQQSGLSASPLQQPASALAVLPQSQPLSLPPPPPPPVGYVSRPASTSGSSDVSSSCGGNNGMMMMMMSSCIGGTMQNTKNSYCRSPSPRSPSPFPLAFSVDNILRPEFGSKLHHHHHLLHNNRGRPSSTSPPLPLGSITASKLQFNIDNCSKQQQQSPLLKPSALQPTSLLRPSPTRPNVTIAPKRPAAITVIADKAKRKPAPSSLQSSSPINSINNNNKLTSINGADVHHLNPDDSVNNNNNNNNDNDQESGSDAAGSIDQQANEKELWPAWVYCTRYSDRPSSGKNKIIYFFFFCTNGCL